MQHFKYFRNVNRKLLVRVNKFILGKLFHNLFVIYNSYIYILYTKCFDKINKFSCLNEVVCNMYVPTIKQVHVSIHICEIFA